MWRRDIDLNWDMRSSLVYVQELIQVDDDVAEVCQRLESGVGRLGLRRHLAIQKRDILLHLFGRRLAAQGNPESGADLRLLLRTGNPQHTPGESLRLPDHEFVVEKCERLGRHR